MGIAAALYMERKGVDQRGQALSHPSEKIPTPPSTRVDMPEELVGSAVVGIVESGTSLPLSYHIVAPQNHLGGRLNECWEMLFHSPRASQKMGMRLLCDALL